MSALITKNKNERVQLGSIRFMFAVVTNIVMGFSVTSGVAAFGGGAAGWRMVAIICAVIGLVVNTISCLCVKELPEEKAEVKEAGTQDDKVSFTQAVKILFSNGDDCCYLHCVLLYEQSYNWFCNFLYGKCSGRWLLTRYV